MAQQDDVHAAELLRVEEVARRLKISRSTLYALLLSGEVPSLRIGRLRRIPSSALDEWMDSQLKGDH